MHIGHTVAITIRGAGFITDAVDQLDERCDVNMEYSAEQIQAEEQVHEVSDIERLFADLLIKSFFFYQVPYRLTASGLKL